MRRVGRVTHVPFRVRVYGAVRTMVKEGSTISNPSAKTGAAVSTRRFSNPSAMSWPAVCGYQSGAAPVPLAPMDRLSPPGARLNVSVDLRTRLRLCSSRGN